MGKNVEDTVFEKISNFIETGILIEEENSIEDGEV